MTVINTARLNLPTSPIENLPAQVMPQPIDAEQPAPVTQDPDDPAALKKAVGDSYNRQSLTTQLQAHPLGNFSGAMGWPTPLAQQDQDAITHLLNSQPGECTGLPLADPRKGVLGYLLSGSDLTSADLKNTSLAMEKLLGSPKARALGEALQARLNGIPTDTSLNDYLLAAIHMGLDAQPRRTSVAGFDLTRQAHWGQPPSVVIEGLARHLVDQGSAGELSANLAARMLLARVAPEFLVKDIPAAVTYGSLTWVQLAIATARLEADSPGRVLNMTYAQVLTAAADEQLTQLNPPDAQHNALREWAAVNGLQPSEREPTTAEMTTIRNAFNQKLEALKATSTLLRTPLPEREAMALERLRAAFPDVEASVFRARTVQKAWANGKHAVKLTTMRSMLDIVMEGDKVSHAAKEYWTTQDKRVPLSRFCQLSEAGELNVASTFKDEFDKSITALETGHKQLSTYLISTLPPAERKDLQNGKLEFFHTNDYTIATDFYSPPALKKKGHTLRVKTTREGEANIYEIDTREGTIKKENYLKAKYQPPYAAKNLETRNANILSKTELFNPFSERVPDPAQERSPSSGDLSVRGDYIGEVLVKALDLGHNDLLQHARGMTAYDTTRAINDAMKDFFLNLIPLRSAIVNFSRGNLGEGFHDLGVDVIGLVSLGTGKAAQAGKVAAKGVTTVSGAARAGRFIGAAALEAVNPLGGVSDLLNGATRLIQTAARLGRQTVNTLRGASGSYDLLKAASARHGLVATGKYRAAHNSVDCGAVFRDGNWYAYDAVKRQPYGTPLKDFRPEVTAAGGELKAVIEPELSIYEIKDLSSDSLARKGLQANVYVGPGQAEYVKIDGRLYASHVKDGVRVVRPPSGSGPEFPVRDLGSAGWEPTFRTHRLLGGSPPATKWQLNDTTYVLPIDDLQLKDSATQPYTIRHNGVERNVTFDCHIGAWRTPNPTAGIDPGNHSYFWRVRKGQWEMGNLDAFKRARNKLDAHQFKFVEVSPSVILKPPKDIKPIPKDIHYFWAGGDISSKLLENIANNARHSPGYRSIIHIDADDPATIEKLRARLKTQAPGVTVMDLNNDDFFQQLKTSPMYSYFRQGQGKNLAATSDVARYPLMQKYGGIYLDTDDMIKKNVGKVELSAGSSDILLNKPVMHKVTGYQPFYNTSNFATQPNNPVIRDMIDEMQQRFDINKHYFVKNRPTVSRKDGIVDYTPEFIEYERKIFATVGPNLFDDVLKSRRPDMYDIGFDGSSKQMEITGNRLKPGQLVNLQKELRDYYSSKGINPPVQLNQQIKDMKDHYVPLSDKFPVEIGAEHSWIDS